MTQTTEYKVMRPFKYDGTMMERGDTWEPIGGKWDHALIAGPYVKAVEVDADPALEDLPLTELRKEAKRRGVERWWLKKRETILDELGGRESDE